MTEQEELALLKEWQTRAVWVINCLRTYPSILEASQGPGSVLRLVLDTAERLTVGIEEIHP